MKWYKQLAGIFFCLVLVNPLFSWGEHYLLSATALKTQGRLKHRVRVEPITTFIYQNSAEINQLLTGYYRWLKNTMGRKIPEAYLEQPLPLAALEKDSGILAGFLRATRLNPQTKFLLVNRVLPGQQPRFERVEPKKVSPYLPLTEKYYTEFENVAGQFVSAASVLATFSDEPDWQMDHELFNIKEYGYGEIPYGKPRGISSKAAFHMQFDHEPLVIRLVKPGIARGMVHDRVELFVRLARLAMQQGHEYWAYRFTAWAIHYVQDLSQPYHSKLVPFADLPYYLDYAVTWNKKHFERRATHLLANRHFAYEGFVVMVLASAFTRPTAFNQSLAQSLQAGKTRLPLAATGLSQRTGSLAAARARRLDAHINQQWGHTLNKEDFNIFTDKSGKVEEAIKNIEKYGGPLVKSTGHNFKLAGQATRAIVNLVTRVEEEAI